MKFWIAEWIAIIRKRKLYKDIEYTKKQKENIKNMWINNYGKTISYKWHKLYQSINGVYKEDYFPEIIYTTKLEPKLNPINISKVLSNKSITELIYNRVSEVRFPETIIVNGNGYYYNASRDIISKKESIEILLNIDEFVIKPTIGGSSGEGVKIIDFENIKKIERKRKIAKLLNDYKKDYIIQRRLKAAKNYEKLYPSSINTIRIITYILKNQIWHVPVCLRIGVGGNKIDNIHAGGIVIGISDDGYLKKYGYQLGYGDSKNKYTIHPDTNIKFENYKVSEIPKTIKIAKKLHKNTPHIGIISWDFMIDNNNEVVLVEGNYLGQSIWFPQIVHGKSAFGENTEDVIRILK